MLETMDLRKLIKNMLKKGYLMSLGTIDKGGVWVADVIFVNDEFDIYWISETSTRHSKALKANPKVAATITLSNKSGEDNLGLQISGKAEKVKGGSLNLSVRHFAKRGKRAPKKDILEEGEAWYKLTPKKIEIIHEKKFGFDKKALNL